MASQTVFTAITNWNWDNVSSRACASFTVAWFNDWRWVEKQVDHHFAKLEDNIDTRGTHLPPNIRTCLRLVCTFRLTSGDHERIDNQCPSSSGNMHAMHVDRGLHCRLGNAPYLLWCWGGHRTHRPSLFSLPENIHVECSQLIVCSITIPS